MFSSEEMDEIKRMRRLSSGYCQMKDVAATDILLELESQLTEEQKYELLEASYEADEMISEVLYDDAH